MLGKTVSFLLQYITNGITQKPRVAPSAFLEKRGLRMVIADIVERLGLTQNTECNGAEVTGVYCCDLLSNALTKLSAGQLFITVMNNPNTIAVAFAKNASAVVLPEGIKPAPALLQAAAQHKICVLTTEMTAFELCCELGKLL